MQQQQVAQVFGKRSFAESVFRSLGDACGCKGGHPHRVVADAAISVGGISETIGNVVAAHGTGDVAVSFQGIRLADAVD